MTLPIVGDLLLNRKPLKGRLREAVHSLTLNLSTSDVGELTVELIDRHLNLWASNQLARGQEIHWSVAGFERRFLIAVTEIDEVDGVELVRLRCRPAAIEHLRNSRGVYTWANQSPTDWLANECTYWSHKTGVAIGFVGQPTMTRSQIVRRAERGTVPESSWDVAGNLASEEGFWLFEHADVVYFASPSWLATEHAGSERDQWTWPRPANGKTPLEAIPKCRASDYAQKADLQPAVIDVQVPMEYALTLAPGQTIRAQIPGFKGRYLLTNATITAGAGLAAATITSPVDPAPHTDMVTISNPTTALGSDPGSLALSDQSIAAYFSNALVILGYQPVDDDIAIAVAVALAGSRGIPTRHNPVPPDDSYGLWQINVLGGIHDYIRDRWESVTHTGIVWPANLTTPEVNAFAAVIISSGGKHWAPWTTFTHGTYKEFLTRGRVAVAELALPVAAGGFAKQGQLYVITPQVSAVAPMPDVKRFVQFCHEQIGDEYQKGSAGPDKWDCSGLVYGALTSMGHTGLPRTAKAIFEWCKNAGKEITVPQAKNIEGALLFRLDSGPTDHVVVSLGDGVNDIEAKGEKYGVVEDREGNRFDHAALIPVIAYTQ